MHSTHLIQEVVRLLRETPLSQRQIAARLNISRGTVSGIASGRRGLYGKDTDAPSSPLTPSAPPTRCPRCGYRVYLPCIICRIRDQQSRNRLSQQLAARRPSKRWTTCVKSNRRHRHV